MRTKTTSAKAESRTRLFYSLYYRIDYSRSGRSRSSVVSAVEERTRGAATRTCDTEWPCRSPSVPYKRNKSPEKAPRSRRWRKTAGYVCHVRCAGSFVIFWISVMWWMPGFPSTTSRWRITWWSGGGPSSSVDTSNFLVSRRYAPEIPEDLQAETIRWSIHDLFFYPCWQKKQKSFCRFNCFSWRLEIVEKNTSAVC